MNITWLQLLPALLLLWMPRQALRVGGRVFEFQRHHRRRRAFDTNPAKARDPNDPSVSFRAEMRKLRNYIDFARAGLGAVMLMGGAPGIDPAWQSAADADPATARLVTYGRLAILLMGVVIQVFRIEHKPMLFAPIFYLTGLSLGLGGLAAGGFALIGVWLVNPVLPTPAAFLSVHALLLVIFGAWFLGLSHKLPLLNGALVFLPVVISLLAGRPLVQLNKKRTSGDLVR